MSFDYDVDEMDSEEQDYVAADGSEYGGDFSEEFGDINFEELGVNPTAPTTAKPGTEEKVLMLAARYAAGVPLWHNEDCYDHGPGQSLARLIRKS